VTLVGWLLVLAASVVVAGLSVVTVLRRRRGRSTRGSGGPEADDLDLDLHLEEGGTGEGERADLSLSDEHLQARDRVGFTLYRPEEVAGGSVVPVIAYAHLVTEEILNAGQPPEVPSEVEEDVARHFQPTDRVQASTADHTGRFAPSDALTFRLTVDGCLVSPSEAVVRWEPPFQSVRFDVAIPHTIPGPQLMGRLVVYEGIFVRGTVEFSLRLGSAEGAGVPVAGRAFDKVFPSYSHQDAAIVDYVEEAARSLGHEFLRDVRKLRAGELWNEEIQGYIEEADLFQLFWSSRSMASPYVRQEWEHALSLGRRGFILPVYWEDPLPSSPQEGLPPPALERIHFHHLYVRPRDPSPEVTPVVPVPESVTRPRPVPPQEPGPLPPPAPPSEATMTFPVPADEQDPEAGPEARSRTPTPAAGRLGSRALRFNPMVWMPAAAVLLVALAVPAMLTTRGTSSGPGPGDTGPTAGGSTSGPPPVDPGPPPGGGIPVVSAEVRVGVPMRPGDSLTLEDRERIIRRVLGALGEPGAEVKLIPILLSGIDPSDLDSIRSLATRLGATHLVRREQGVAHTGSLEIEELPGGGTIHR